jgi:hypothetical protein
MAMVKVTREVFVERCTECPERLRGKSVDGCWEMRQIGGILRGRRTKRGFWLDEALLERVTK